MRFFWVAGDWAANQDDLLWLCHRRARETETNEYKRAEKRTLIHKLLNDVAHFNPELEGGRQAFRDRETLALTPALSPEERVNRSPACR